ncbi:PD40 domain-containing protein [Pseudoalteromonas sp. SR45-6]|uniref:TolB family protein n=1 Tax=Pseudoalteromonas sp. SR45-6 TaxID=2760927 RepID=UPI001604A0E5|nr:PD40 domain-containing protein [Pseudoalteromonas sp. SR45-6]MBB1340718.1 PD40 domain-containing protein [Pseudoalteromonas sp. SR45-6]
MKKTLLATSLLLATHTQAAVQWQTIYTEHFNVHYSQENADWARSAANELEIVRSKVLEQQNRALDEAVDVVVFDPLNAANGFALPVSNKPLMALFTTPPQSDTVISNNSGWQQLLVLHEYIHLVHLAQPTRSKWRQELRNIWDLYDITHSEMPRWVAEGYATLLESKMTGRGRLFDNYSEAILIEFAQQGALPRYDQLNSTDGGFMAGSMAYLMGARFLAWLEKNYSEQTLDAVWTRMQGVKQREFDDAFEGVFGDSASKLYRRFIAEYTYQAMSKERSEQSLTSELWLALDHYASGPALSPNSEQLAVVERDQDGKTQLKLYSTEDNLKAAEEFNQEQQELLADDPKDVADKPPKVFQRKQKQVLNQINRAGIQNPQWLNDDVLYFSAYSNVDNIDNQRISDIFSWDTQTGEVTKLTDLAGLRRFSIADNGQTLYGEQVKGGYSELVRVDLQTGQAQPLFEKSLATVYDYPVVSPNQQQLAFLKTEFNHNWQLYIQDIDGQKSIAVPMPKGYQYLSQPSWSADGKQLYFVAGLAQATDIYRYDLTTQRLFKLTQGQQAVANPLALSDGDLLYFSISSDGPDIMQLQVNNNEEEITDFATNSIAPLLLVNEHTLPKAQIYQQPIGEQTHYDIWQQKATFALGEQYHSASAALFSASIKGSDLLKQLDWQLGYSVDLHDTALQGIYAQARYSALAIKFDSQLFSYDLNASKQYQHSLLADQSVQGGYIAASLPLSFGEFKVQPELAYNYSEIDDANIKQEQSSQWLRVGLKQSWSYDRQDYAIGQAIDARWYSGDSDTQSWQGYDVSAQLFGKALAIPMYANYSQQYRDDSELRLGGFSSSLLSKNIRSDLVFAPELPFYSAIGKRYQGYGGGISWAEGMPWLYYQQHQIDQQVYGQSYGVKWQGPFSFGLGPAGLNDVKLDFGLVRVEGDSFDDELRGWLGFYYSL